MIDAKVYIPKLRKEMSLKNLEKELKNCDKAMEDLRLLMAQVEVKGYPTEAGLERAWNTVDKKIDRQYDYTHKVRKRILDKRKST